MTVILPNPHSRTLTLAGVFDIKRTFSIPYSLLYVHYKPSSNAYLKYLTIIMVVSDRD